MKVEYRTISCEGDTLPDHQLEKDIEGVWEEHKSFIAKVLVGLGMLDWTVSFYRSHRLPLDIASGALFPTLKKIFIGSHSSKKRTDNNFLA